MINEKNKKKDKKVDETISDNMKEEPSIDEGNCHNFNPNDILTTLAPIMKNVFSGSKKEQSDDVCEFIIRGSKDYVHEMVELLLKE